MDAGDRRWRSTAGGRQGGGGGPLAGKHVAAAAVDAVAGGRDGQWKHLEMVLLQLGLGETPTLVLTFQGSSSEGWLLVFLVT